jgi:hypothetical protein
MRMVIVARTSRKLLLPNYIRVVGKVAASRASGGQNSDERLSALSALAHQAQHVAQLGRLSAQQRADAEQTRCQPYHAERGET